MTSLHRLMALALTAIRLATALRLLAGAVAGLLPVLRGGAADLGMHGEVSSGGAPGWVPGSEPAIEAQPVNP